jgi:hypothetical protein
MKIMRTISIAVSLLLLALPAVAQSGPCQPRDPISYWLWERYSGVGIIGETGGQRQWTQFGRLDPCYTTPLSGINEPMARIWGYRMALEEWSKSLPFDAKQWSTPETVAVRQKISQLLGRNFESLADFQKWWQENADYLIVDEATHKMVVDEQAKAAKRPISTRNAEHEISAENYWFYEGMRGLVEVIDDADSLRGKTATYDSHEAEIRFRISKPALTDRQAKEAGYKRAVSLLIEKLGEQVEERGQTRSLQSALTRITGRKFGTASEWENWWRARKQTITLDREGAALRSE